MKNKTPKEAATPFSIRLTFQERQQLKHQAGSQPLSAYVKRMVLGEQAGAKAPYRRASVDEELAARVLAILGKSGIGRSLQRLADFAASGSLELDGRTEARLLDACEDVQAVRELLMDALGKKTGRNGAADSSRPSARSDFGRAAR